MVHARAFGCVAIVLCCVVLCCGNVCALMTLASLLISLFLSIFHRFGFAVAVQDGVHMYDLGAGAVRVGPSASGVESNVAQRNVGTVVTNSVLEQGGAYYQEGCGVLAGQVVGLNVSHNIIRNFSYTGVSVGM